MAKQQNIQKQENDSTFILKVVLYLVFGTFWIGVINGDSTYPIPVGLALGLYFAHYEHFQIDRKIEYVVLILSAAASFLFDVGFVLLI